MSNWIRKLPMALLPPDPRYIFRGDMGCVNSVHFRVNSHVEHLYAGTVSGNIYIWDLKTNRLSDCLTTKEDSCLHVQTTHDNDLFVQHKSGMIQRYRITESKWVLDKSFNIDFCNFCRFRIVNENKAFVPLRKSVVGLLCTNTFKLEAELNPSDLPYFNKLGEVMAIVPVNNKSELILVCYEGGNLILWDAKQGKVLSCLEMQPTPMTLDLDTSSRKGIIGGPTNELEVFDLSVSHSLSAKAKVTIKNPGTSIVAVRPDDKIVAVGGWDSRVRIFSWKTLRPLAVLDQHKATIHDIAYSTQEVEAYNNKRLMATAARDGCIALWDIYN